MPDFVIKQLPYDLSQHAGLALIGKYLKRINLNALVDPAYPVRSGIANSDILKSYLGLLCLGKNDFDALMPSKASAKTLSSPAPWACVRCPRRPHCASAWALKAFAWSLPCARSPSTRPAKPQH